VIEIGGRTEISKRAIICKLFKKNWKKSVNTNMY
jgi:hypothetical protein